MLSWVKLEELVQWTGAKISRPLVASRPVVSISSDSRSFKSGEVFIAIRGENFDGHSFLDEVTTKGAVAIIGEKKPDSWNEAIPFLEVPNSLKAYVAIGKALRKSFRGKVLAVTGSAGKSSTKDMVGALLGPNTLVSPKSFNNLLGVSKTLCLIEDSTENLVLEMGMNGFGEIQEMCENFCPEGGAITNIGDAHIGKLGGKEGIYRAKKELFDWLNKVNPCLGVAINLDDPLVVRAAKEAFKNKIRTVSYSAYDPKADIFISERKINPESGSLSLAIKTDGGELRTSIPHFGVHHAHNLAAAISMARLAGTPWDEIKNRLSQLMPSESRGQISQLPNQITLIDESYNSNPSALLSSLESVILMNPGRRKILVIGEMRELDQFSETLHREVGRKIGMLFLKDPDKAILVGAGKETRALLEEGKVVNPKMVTFFANSVEEVTPKVLNFLQKGDLVFVKGSRGIRLDLLVKTLKG